MSKFGLPVIVLILVGFLVIIGGAKDEPTIEFREPTDYNLDELDRVFKARCSSTDFRCFAKVLREVTDKYHPQAAIDLVERWQDGGSLLLSVDDHQLAHEIGRQTAESYGINSRAFLLCPMSSFNGGCQHGFFEFVLGRTETTAEAADLICKSLGKEHSAKFKFYCYHGVGHGVLMARAYDLFDALRTCDTLGSYSAQDGCWQGVFMENTNVGISGQARSGIFSDQDPLAPCNVVEEKYRHECFINHAGWLMRFFNNSTAAAARACLGEQDSGSDPALLNAPSESDINSCLESIGLMVTNPVWQEDLSDRYGQAPFEVVAWELCQEFPTSRQERCVAGAVDNIMNFDGLDVGRAKVFCETVADRHQDACYRRIGAGLRWQAVHESAVTEQCARLGEFEDLCRDSL